MVEYLNFLTPHLRNCLQKYGCGVVEQRCFKKLRTADKKMLLHICGYAIAAQNFFKKLRTAEKIAVGDMRIFSFKTTFLENVEDI
jgi:hypothetical protein